MTAFPRPPLGSAALRNVEDFDAAGAATTAIAAIEAGVSSSFDTLAEIAAAILAVQSAASALSGVVATKAPLASPDFSGAPAVASLPLSTRAHAEAYADAAVLAEQTARTAAITAAINALVAGAPNTLDTLLELADALAADESGAAALAALVGSKAPLASPALTGAATLGGQALATTPGVASAVAAAVAPLAPLASPALTGAATLGGQPLATAATVAAAVAPLAPLASPALTGAPTINGVAVATVTAITTAIANLVNSAPTTLDTLGEIATALQSDETAAAALLTAVAGKQPLNANLTAIALLTTTPFGRGLLALADAASVNAALGLGTAALHASTDFDDASAAGLAVARPVLGMARNQQDQFDSSVGWDATTTGKAAIQMVDRSFALWAPAFGTYVFGPIPQITLRTALAVTTPTGPYAMVVNEDLFALGAPASGAATVKVPGGATYTITFTGVVELGGEAPDQLTGVVFTNAVPPNPTTLPVGTQILIQGDLADSAAHALANHYGLGESVKQTLMPGWLFDQTGALNGGHPVAKVHVIDVDAASQAAVETDYRQPWDANWRNVHAKQAIDAFVAKLRSPHPTDPTKTYADVVTVVRAAFASVNGAELQTGYGSSGAPAYSSTTTLMTNNSALAPAATGDVVMTAPAWVSGTAYALGALVADASQLYYALNAVTSATHPAADTTNWVAIPDGKMVIQRNDAALVTSPASPFTGQELLYGTWTNATQTFRIAASGDIPGTAATGRNWSGTSNPAATYAIGTGFRVALKYLAGTGSSAAGVAAGTAGTTDPTVGTVVKLTGAGTNAGYPAGGTVVVAVPSGERWLVQVTAKTSTTTTFRIVARGWGLAAGTAVAAYVAAGAVKYEATGMFPTFNGISAWFDATRLNPAQWDAATPALPASFAGASFEQYRRALIRDTWKQLVDYLMARLPPQVTAIVAYGGVFADGNTANTSTAATFDAAGSVQYQLRNYLARWAFRIVHSLYHLKTWTGLWSGAAAFAAGTTYILGDLVNSTDGLTYVCILGYTAGATLPQADSAHWVAMKALNSADKQWLTECQQMGLMTGGQFGGPSGTNRVAEGVNKQIVIEDLMANAGATYFEGSGPSFTYTLPAGSHPAAYPAYLGSAVGGTAAAAVAADSQARMSVSAAPILSSQSSLFGRGLLRAADQPAAQTLLGITGTPAVIETAALPLADTPVASPGAASKASAADHVHPRGLWTPPDHNLACWAYDPAAAAGNTGYGPSNAGVSFVIRIHNPIVQPVANLILSVLAAGAGLTANQNGAALYTVAAIPAAGSWSAFGAKGRIATVADQAAAWVSTGTKTIALVAEAGADLPHLPVGDYFVVVWVNGTTAPTFTRGCSQALVNVGLSGNNCRFATADTITTTPPSTLGALSGLSNSPWAGLS